MAASCLMLICGLLSAQAVCGEVCSPGRVGRECDISLKSNSLKSTHQKELREALAIEADLVEMEAETEGCDLFTCTCIGSSISKHCGAGNNDPARSTRTHQTKLTRDHCHALGHSLFTNRTAI